MKKKLIQLIIVLAGTLLLAHSALSGDAVKAKKPDTPPVTPAEDTIPKEDGKTEPSPEELLLASVEPEAYRTVKDLNVQPGAYISVLMREGNSAFSRSFKDGAKQACSDLNENLGYTGSDKVKVSCNVPSEDTVTAQINILDEELALYPDVVAASITDASACEVQFDLAMENGIYIAGFDASPGYDQVAVTVETDNKAAASQAADRMAAAIQSKKQAAKEEAAAAAESGESPSGEPTESQTAAPEESGPAQILIVSHDGTSANLAARESAFAGRIAEQYPELTCAATCHLSDIDQIKAEMAAFYNEDEDPANDVVPEELGREDIYRYYLTRLPNLKGVFAADEASATEILKYLTDNMELSGISVVAFGSTESLQPYLNSDMLAAYVEENGYGMGYATAVAAFRIAAEKGNVEKVTVGYTVWPEQ